MTKTGIEDRKELSLGKFTKKKKNCANFFALNNY